MNFPATHPHSQSRYSPNRHDCWKLGMHVLQIFFLCIDAGIYAKYSCHGFFLKHQKDDDILYVLVFVFPTYILESLPISLYIHPPQVFLFLGCWGFFYFNYGHFPAYTKAENVSWISAYPSLRFQTDPVWLVFHIPVSAHFLHLPTLLTQVTRAS